MSDKISNKAHLVLLLIILEVIRNKISAATLCISKTNRIVRPVTLVAVSKRQPDDRIDAALTAGQRVFGENRVQEANLRWAPRREQFYTDLNCTLLVHYKPIRSAML